MGPHLTSAKAQVPTERDLNDLGPYYLPPTTHSPIHSTQATLAFLLELEHLRHTLTAGLVLL